MLPVGLEWIEHQGRFWIDGYFKMKEQAAGVTGLTPASDFLHFYAKDKAGVTELYYKNSSGTERDLSLVASALQGITVGSTTLTSGTAGSVLFVGSGPILQQDNANLFWDDSNNELLVGSNTRTDTGGGHYVQVARGQATGLLLHVASPTAAQAPQFSFYRSGNTLASLLQASSGNTVGQINFKIYDSNSWEDCARIHCLVDGAVGNGDTPGALVFSTTPDGSATIAERMRIAQNGDVYIGHTAFGDTAIAGRGFQVARVGIAETALYSCGGGISSLFRGLIARGTLSSPTAAQANDGIAFVTQFATGAGTWAGGASSRILLSAAENISTTAQGSYISLETTPIGSTIASRAERMRIIDRGHLVLPELSTDPTTTHLTADAAIAIYTKNDKLVFAYNNGGVMTYITLDLDGSDTTWSHGTTAP